MDAERRKELLQQLDYGESAPTIEVLRHELRALLARDEALERVTHVIDTHECEYGDPDAIAAVEKYDKRLHQALGRD